MSVVIDRHQLSLPSLPAASASGATNAAAHRPAAAIAADGSGVGRGYLWSLRLLSFAALMVSGYLAWISFTSGKVAGCGSGSVFDCSHVMTTRWSRVGGVPVGVPAAILHATLLGLLFVPSSLKRLAALRWSAISFAALSAGLAALWFVGLQLFWVQHLCTYCLVAHSCGIALAGLILWRRPAGGGATLLSAAAAVLATGGLVSSQLLAAPPVTHELIEYTAPVTTTPEAAAVPATEDPGVTADPESVVPTEQNAEPEAAEVDIFEAPFSQHQAPKPPSQIGGLQWAVMQLVSPATMFTAQVDAAAEGGTKASEQAAPAERKTVKILNSVRLDVKHWPLVGSPDADYFFVEMLDYTCPHCRATHPAISQTRAAYGGRLAVVLLPTPLDRQCNPHATSSGGQTADACNLAKLSVAVWRLKPDQFEAFHDWLMTNPPNYSAAYPHAAQIVGAEALKQELASGTPSAYIAKNVDLYNRAGKGAIPKMLFPTTSAVGEIRSSETLKSLVERHVVQAPR